MSGDALAVVGAGAWLKNAACLLRSDAPAGDAHWSPQHGDLSTPQACIALEASLQALLRHGPVDAIAHDLHPDFHSTRLAQAMAARLGVPAIAVQHHHAHVAVALAEHGLDEPAIGIALDGVGLGTDGTAWGGELLLVDGARLSRVGHLQPLLLPGGDVAAREPWRMAASVLASMKRGTEIAPRFGPRVGQGHATMLATMLGRRLNCPVTTSAGRWFDAAAAALGLADRQSHEAEAAMRLEQHAARWLATHDAPRHDPFVFVSDDVVDLRPVLGRLFDVGDAHAHAGADDARDQAAALFHLVLAEALAAAAHDAARAVGCDLVVLAGGCFLNTVLRTRLDGQLRARGLRVVMPGPAGVGDAGLALGQAWVGVRALRAAPARNEEMLSCA